MVPRIPGKAPEPSTAIEASRPDNSAPTLSAGHSENARLIPDSQTGWCWVTSV